MISFTLSCCFIQLFFISCKGQYSSTKSYPYTSNEFSHIPSPNNYYNSYPYAAYFNSYNPYHYPSNTPLMYMHPGLSYPFLPPLYYPSAPGVAQSSQPQLTSVGSNLQISNTSPVPPTVAYIPSTLQTPQQGMLMTTPKPEQYFTPNLNNSIDVNDTDLSLCGNASEPMETVANPQVTDAVSAISSPMVATNLTHALTVSPLCNSVNPVTSLLNNMPFGQGFYPLGYGPWNPFGLSPSIFNYTSPMWSQQLTYPPLYPENPFMQYEPVMPEVNPAQKLENATATIFNSNGDTGTDVNSLPPQVKDFMDMLPDILNMPQSAAFAQSNQHHQQPAPISSLHHRLPRLPLYKIKNPLYKKKYYSPPNQYYNNDF